MKRRNFLVGAGAASIGGSALLGSGAFSRVESRRDMTIQVAEDPDAYLGMDACQDDGNTTPNSSFTEIDGNGHLRIDMGDSGHGGYGVNSNSQTWFDNVFQLCNQGKEGVCLWIDHKDGADPDRVTFYVNESDPGETPEKLVDAEDRAAWNVQELKGPEDSIYLGLGECVCVGIRVDTRIQEDNEWGYDLDAPSYEDDPLLEVVEIVADVNEEACRIDEPECANLEAEFKCITTDNGVDNRNGHRLNVTNFGTGDTDFGLAILNSPDELEDIGERSVDADETITVRGRDASFPLAGIVFWEDECEEIPGATRVEDWNGIETPIGIDPDAFPWGDVSADRDRYDDVIAIEDIDDFNAALVAPDPEEGVPTTGVFVAEIDYSGFDPEDEDDIGRFLCNGGD